MLDYGRIERNTLCYIGMMINYADSVYVYDPARGDRTVEFMAEQVYAGLRGWL
jgi:hypothetical protein